MANLIRADNGVSSGVTGIVQTADSSGQLALQTTTSGGVATTALTIDNSQNVGVGTVTPSFPNGTGVAIYNSTVPRLKFTNSTTGDTSTDGTQLLVSGSDFYIQQREAASVIISTNNTNAVTVDSSGNLGLGVTPSAWASGTGAIQMPANNSYSQYGVAKNIYYNGSNYAYIANGYATLYQQNSSGQHVWLNATSGSAGGTASLTQAMTLNNNGSFSIGSTNSSYPLDVSGNSTLGATIVGIFRGKVSGDVGTASLYIAKYDNNQSTSQVFMTFTSNQGLSVNGQINGNGSGQAAFGSTSDITLKTNITPLEPQLANINALELIEFDYIESEGGGHNVGFSAQNMQTIYPDTVGTRADGKLTLTGWNKTEARLVKAIQELSAELTALKLKVGA